MNKDEAIKQLQSLRESISDYARGNDDPVFREDVEALDYAIDFLNSNDNDRGEWVYDSRTNEPHCSECGRYGEITPYCPHCGAKMEEDNERN